MKDDATAMTINAPSTKRMAPGSGWAAAMVSDGVPGTVRPIHIRNHAKEATDSSSAMPTST